MSSTILLALVVFIIFIGLIFIVARKKPKIEKSQVIKLIQKINQTQKLDPSHGLIESHKIFIAGIESLSSREKSAAEKVKKIADDIPNIKKVWYFHRMRNRVAHEPDFRISKKQAEEARIVFSRALKSLT